MRAAHTDTCRSVFAVAAPAVARPTTRSQHKHIHTQSFNGRTRCIANIVKENVQPALQWPMTSVALMKLRHMT